MVKTKALLLAAGTGTRLKPYTNSWPKCLMPIKGRPLLEYWLSLLKNAGIHDILINLHHHADIVRDFINRPYFKNLLNTAFEPELLGTAGTLRTNSNFFINNPILLIHADNLCCCNLEEFIYYHHRLRPAGTMITMMTFECHNPESCGIVEINELGIVKRFHEKIKNPPGNLANAAVYILEPEILDWILDHQEINDFSTEVIPSWVGKIATWKNDKVHRDIGTPAMLQAAQYDECELPALIEDEWTACFINNEIHKKIYFK